MSQIETMKKYKRLALLCAFALAFCRTAPAEDVKKENEDILFMNVPVVVTASLTEVNPRLVPAAISTITEEQIQASGARSLFELLDIYVPNLQWWRNHWEADNMGLRGILSDRDDKYLILVNGRVMNERTHYGALSERDFPLLKDIHHIDVVRGPGSALYGPGAVAMVINIITHNAQTFEGTDITSRLGAIEEFYSTEIRHGQKFDDGDGGIFAYAGISKYNGASAGNARQIYGVDFVRADGSSYDADDPFLDPSINDGETHRNLPPLKFYAQITKDEWDIWGRYTRGGKQIMWPTGAIAQSPYGWTDSWILPYSDSSYGYRQWTAFVGNTKQLDDTTSLETSFSYDRFYLSRIIHTWLQESYREDKYIGRAIIKQEFNQRHKVAYGFEVLHGEYGFANTEPYDNDAFNSAFNNLGGMPRWSTNLYSLLGEWQWKISDEWTSFLDARLDDHTYTSPMFSPRAALVHMPNEKETYKLIWARSVRANYEEEMKKTDMTLGKDSDTEKLDSVL